MSKFNPVAGSAIIPGVEVLLGTLGGGVPPGSPILTLFQTNVIFQTRFQTRPQNSIPLFRPGV